MISHTIDTLEEYISELRKGQFHDIEIIQTSQGKFHSSHHTAYLGEMMLHDRQLTAASIQRANHDEGAITFIMTYDCPAPTMNGCLLESNVVIIPNDLEVVCQFPPLMRGIVITLPQENLRPYLGDETFKSFMKTARNAFLVERMCHAESQLKEKLMNKTREVMQIAQTLNPQAYSDAEDSIMVLLCALILEMHPYWKNTSAANRHRIVERAREALTFEPETTTTVADLIEKTHCSQRALTYAFSQAFGLTPKQYLVLHRMHLIRNHITQGLVTDWKSLCEHYGISNPHRFSKDYEALFGTPLKDTLKSAVVKRLN